MEWGPDRSLLILVSTLPRNPVGLTRFSVETNPTLVSLLYKGVVLVFPGPDSTPEDGLPRVLLRDGSSLTPSPFRGRTDWSGVPTPSSPTVGDGTGRSRGPDGNEFHRHLRSVLKRNKKHKKFLPRVQQMKSWGFWTWVGEDPQSSLPLPPPSSPLPPVLPTSSYPT